MDDEVDLAELAAVCAAVLACYDELLRDRPAAPAQVDAAPVAAPGLPGIPGRVWWALDLVGRGAAGATPAELALAIEVLRAVATGRAPVIADVARL
jgi:hypothetical protein